MARPALLARLLLGGVLLLGLSCAGPQPEAPTDPPSDEEERVYHVQLYMTETKDDADRVLGKAVEWWESRSSAELPEPAVASDQSPVAVKWRPPMYRVRLGPFPTRQEAQTVLSAARSAFPEAFVAPERRSQAP